MELEYETHIAVAECCELGFLHLHYVGAVVDHFAAVGSFERAYYLKQRGFAGSAGPDNGEKLAIIDGEARLVKHPQAVIALDYVLYFNHGCSPIGC